MTQVSGNGHKRAVLYLRVSTDEQREAGYGLTGQFNDCMEYAGRLGYQIVGEKSYKLEGGKLVETTDAGATAAYIEDYTGFSRFDDRPAGKQLMAMLKERQADAFIAARVDRIARDSLEARIAARTWLKAGIELHTAQNGRITNDNDIVFLIQSWQGQEDYTKIVKNLRDGRNNKARGGRVVGSHRAPFGYRFIRDAKGKVIGFETCESDAKAVGLIFRWYIHGDETGKRLSLWAIGNKLTALGVPTPAQVRGIDKIRTQAKTEKVLTYRKGVWSATSIVNIIGNEVYAGVWRYGRRIGGGGNGGRRPLSEQIAVSVPAIVERETWEAAQAQRKRNAELSRRNAKQDYLLSGFARCACGRAMAGYSDNRGYSRKRGYRCVSICYRKRADVCKEKSIDGDQAEAYVWACIKRKFENIDELWEELKAAQQGELFAQDPKRDELQAVEDFIAQADREADEIAATMRIAKGRVGERVQKQQDDCNARLEGYHKRRGELIAELGARHLTDDAIEDILGYARDARAGIENATFEDKRRAFEHLKIGVTIEGGQASSIVGVIAFCTLNSVTNADAVSRSRRPAV